MTSDKYLYVCAALTENPDLALLIALHDGWFDVIENWDTKCLEGFWLLTGGLQKAWIFGLDKAWLVWDGYSDLPPNL